MAFEIYKSEWGALRPIRGILFDMDCLVRDSEKLYAKADTLADIIDLLGTTKPGERA